MLDPAIVDKYFEGLPFEKVTIDGDEAGVKRTDECNYNERVEAAMRKIGYILCVTTIMLLLTACGNGAKEPEANDSGLIYEETVSPNEKYVSSEEDKVFYTVQVYQDEKGIVVQSSSNTAFAKALQYEINYDEALSKDDVEIEWTTLMGDTKDTEENQIGIAVVTLSHNDEIFSQRKISFVSNAIGIIVDTINK